MAFKGKYPLRSKIVIHGQIIEQVSSFNYLGFNISHNQNDDIDSKLNKFGRMCGTIRRHLRQKTLRCTQLKFYKTMATPMLRDGSENWLLNRKDKRKIETTEMKFLRAVAGVTLLDHQRNEDIRNQLNIFNMTEQIITQKQNWYTHLQRMNEERLPKIILNYRPTGRRDVGRPKTRWKQSLS